MSGMRSPLIMSGMLSVNALTEVSKTSDAPADTELVIRPIGEFRRLNVEDELFLQTCDTVLQTWTDTARYEPRRKQHMHPFKKRKNHKPWDTP